MSETVTFEAPGPGRWELDRSHYPGGTTPTSQWLISEAMEAGMSRVFAETGVPAQPIRPRFVNGSMYTRLIPLVNADKPPAKLPPRFVLKVATRLHPAFKARRRTAEAALAARPWNDVARRWHTELRPGLDSINRSFQAERPADLDDAALAGHIGKLLDHLRETTELHFWLHGHDLGPIARYLHACIGWGLEPTRALAALAGASPSTSRPLAQLAAIRAELETRGVDPGSLTAPVAVRAVSSKAAALLDEFMAERGEMLVTGYDITSCTLRELPTMLMAGIRSGAEPVTYDHATVTAELRQLVPATDHARFDELLADARGVMDMRDDNGPVTYELPAGLLRRALLEVGRRLVQRSKLQSAEHALELAPSEARDPFGSSTPSGDLLAGRARNRVAASRLPAPDALGPIEPAPPLDVLPRALGDVVAAVQTALVHLAMVGSAEGAATSTDPLAGVGIGDRAYTGVARTAESATEAIEKLEPGDVLVVRATSPAFNAVLAIAGAVVTTDGGALSHAAVLARELGIPAVIGAPGALTIEDGATITVDPVAARVTVSPT